MTRSGTSFIVGALALAGATLATTGAEAMPAAPVAAAAAEAPAAGLEQVQYYYGYRGPFWRYGVRRPYLGYRRFGFRPYGYGFRRPLRPYILRRPFYGYGYRRF